MSKQALDIDRKDEADHKLGNDSAIEIEHPEDHHCPFSLDLMRYPVVTSNGSTYEKSAILEWFARGKITDPLTNEVLANDTLTPNNALKSIIESFKTKAREEKKKTDEKNRLYLEAEINTEKLILTNLLEKSLHDQRVELERQHQAALQKALQDQDRDLNSNRLPLYDKL